MRPSLLVVLFILPIPAVRHLAPSERATELQGGAAALRAAVEYIAREKVQGTVEVDPRDLSGNIADSTVEKTHSPATLSLLAVPGVATVASIGRARQCAADPSRDGCRSAGRAVFISLAAPRIDGRNAVIELRVSTARTPGRADSTAANALKSAADREAFFRRIERPSVSRYRLDLVRETTAWVVTRAVLVGASR
jgi:hypothetical protein